MGFWVFMLLMNLVIPVTMIGFGKLFLCRPPKEINAVFGYRTAMSTKNKDTWEFAHHYCGRIWYIAGWIILPVSVIVSLLMLGKDDDTIGIYSGVLCTIQIVLIITSIIPTEAALKKNFDKYGNPISQNKNKEGEK